MRRTGFTEDQIKIALGEDYSEPPIFYQLVNNPPNLPLVETVGQRVLEALSLLGATSGLNSDAESIL